MADTPVSVNSNYPIRAWEQHPGRNPAFNPEGRRRVYMEHLGIVSRGPRNPSRWLPHIGAKQRAKAARLARGIALLASLDPNGAGA